MRQTRGRDAFESFLSGEVVLGGLLGATLALFATTPSLRQSYDLPQLRLVLTVLYVVGGGLIALLTATRFLLEGRRYDLMLCFGFTVSSLSWIVFAIGPAVVDRTEAGVESWATLGGLLAGWTVLAAAPFVRGGAERRWAWLAETAFAAVVWLLAIWVVTRAADLPKLEPSAHGAVPALRSGVLAALALVNLVAVIGFADRYRRKHEDLDRWLALGATLTLFASLDFLFERVVAVRYVTQGDFLRLIAYGVLVVGVWRAIHASEVGRAIAEERARVAREIHDGLSQYLFAVSTHASMLEAGADPAETIPKLKAAVQAAQTEARFATLALSSAAGRAQFDAALRRYVDFLTADGELEVELDIDGRVRLAPDEQIEVFRIVQEGLANARRHAHARRAWVSIGRRGPERLVTVRDDGDGFEPSRDETGQGLGNMRQRAAAIGGAFSLQTSPGSGTALEIVLRP
jgi:signal transduction histidine kinase